MPELRRPPYRAGRQLLDLFAHHGQNGGCDAIRLRRADHVRLRVQLVEDQPAYLFVKVLAHARGVRSIGPCSATDPNRYDAQRDVRRGPGGTPSSDPPSPSLLGGVVPSGAGMRDPSGIHHSRARRDPSTSLRKNARTLLHLSGTTPRASDAGARKMTRPSKTMRP